MERQDRAAAVLLFVGLLVGGCSDDSRVSDPPPPEDVAAVHGNRLAIGGDLAFVDGQSGGAAILKDWMP